MLKKCSFSLHFNTFLHQKLAKGRLKPAFGVHSIYMLVDAGWNIQHIFITWTLYWWIDNKWLLNLTIEKPFIFNFRVFSGTVILEFFSRSLRDVYHLLGVDEIIPFFQSIWKLKFCSRTSQLLFSPRIIGLGNRANLKVDGRSREYFKGGHFF